MDDDTLIDQEKENSPRDSTVYDFSSDLSINPVADDAPKYDNGHLPKAVALEVAKSLSQIKKPSSPTIATPAIPRPAPTNVPPATTPPPRPGVTPVTPRATNPIPAPISVNQPVKTAPVPIPKPATVPAPVPARPVTPPPAPVVAPRPVQNIPKLNPVTPTRPTPSNIPAANAPALSQTPTQLAAKNPSTNLPSANNIPKNADVSPAQNKPEPSAMVLNASTLPQSVTGRPTVNPFKATANDPFREPIPELNKAWPFASPETLDKNRHRDTTSPYADSGIQNRTQFQVAPIKPSASSNLITSPLGSAPTSRQPIPAKPETPSVPEKTLPNTKTQISTQQATLNTLTQQLQNRQKGIADDQSKSAPQYNYSGTLRNIRTYEGDVAELLANRGVSKASIAISENVKKGEGETIKNTLNTPPELIQENKEPSHIGFKVFMTLASLVLIALGVATGYFFYSKSPVPTIINQPAPQQNKVIPALVPFDTQTSINTDGLTSANLLGKIVAEINKTQSPGTIKEIVFTETKESKLYRVSSSEMATILGVNIPDIILRTLTSQWMLGINAASDGTKTAFVVVNTNLFQNAFAGMLAWEDGLPSDLRRFIIPSSTAVNAPSGEFKNQVIKNKDVRVFTTKDNQILFAYSFIDNTTLIITANPSVLGTILSRLENKSFVR